MTLKRLRQQIDRLDLKVLHLLNRRAALAIRVGELKRKEGHPLLDERRERQILRRITRANGGPFPSGSIRRIFQDILRFSRRLVALKRK